ncbi:hypothetical protein M2459_001674 [Parabacteroides sp. PF5-5]|nr:hypothetical protein [Parabacteroides sp. PH5-39]MDH6315977.1 hypothetical protein [Parabacteroides sp. PF5-13]MDH6319634.1 hypothetical protein [Parabacteroides sp. PH5-13]MDH6323365.1 hypothetical protein [Parabacteroides sp. PH5-8]MDH6327126.1 hypothetical protein [Parabacteroides sp. PH5-41]MDH6334928.1 hypothetical protein [Parabacteroides sp. PF5-5]MDH6345992.1 hypothetical protein [Parabacteroides sp. PH5-46]MDH6360990.1 hypothetical protein [Parabacteroides sp. PH5-16]MDH6376657.
MRLQKRMGAFCKTHECIFLIACDKYFSFSKEILTFDVSNARSYDYHVWR